MANLDLSAASDAVNVKILLKRIKKFGVPDDLIKLVSKWKSTRNFFSSKDGNNSYVYTSNAGTIQGSTLGLSYLLSTPHPCLILMP
jgi:hypothetical protein